MTSPEQNYNNSIKGKLTKIADFVAYNKEGLVGMGLFGFSGTAVKIFEMSSLGDVLPVVVRGHTHDFLSSIAFSYLSRYATNKNVLVNASLGLGVTSAVEIAQGLGIYEGTFDTKDFVAYGLGTAVYLGIEKVRNIRKTRMYAGQEYKVDLNSN